jgi:outer membrane receptor protein involved in Fe transport
MPSIRTTWDLADDQFLMTNVDGMSAGYRGAFTWGDAGCRQLTMGTDLIRVGQQLNDIAPEHEVTLPFPPLQTDYPLVNRPIPRSHSLDVGLFAEHGNPLDCGLTLRTGARVDLVSTTARDRVPGMGIVTGLPFELIEVGLSELKQAELDQRFYPWSVFGTAEYALNCHWTLIGGVGYAMRPPSLTELYARGPWIGSLQPGLTFVEGDPELDPERLVQLDVGLRFDNGDSAVSLTGFYAWAFDYITYDDIQERYQSDPPEPVEEIFIPGEDFQHVAFVNTDLATLMGFELLGEHDFGTWLSGFAVVSYVEGTDHTRTEPSRVAAIIREEALFDPATPRSFDGDTEKEALPGIPPLEARVGIRIHEPAPSPFWGIELEARMVDAQDRVARTLSEQPTSGFTVWNTRGYWRPVENFTLYGGVENFTDRFHREHLDFRAGRGLYRPGVNFYLLTDWVY